MPAYHRPPLDVPEFRDATGAVIQYGNRWGGDSPPDDSYSVVTNLERFAPLHTVADAIIDHLRTTFDVAVSEDASHAADFLHKPERIIRTVRLTPSDPDAAALTFGFTSFPGVIVRAGLLQEFVLPVCGCDACDDTAERLADELEWTTLAIAAGGFREYVQGGLAPRFGMSLESADGQGKRSSDTLATDPPRAVLTSARKRMKALPDGWNAWPPARPGESVDA